MDLVIQGIAPGPKRDFVSPAGRPVRELPKPFAPASQLSALPLPLTASFTSALAALRELHRKLDARAESLAALLPAPVVSAVGPAPAPLLTCPAALLELAHQLHARHTASATHPLRYLTIAPQLATRARVGVRDDDEVPPLVSPALDCFPCGPDAPAPAEMRRLCWAGQPERGALATLCRTPALVCTREQPGLRLGRAYVETKADAQQRPSLAARMRTKKAPVTAPPANHATGLKRPRPVSAADAEDTTEDDDEELKPLVIEATAKRAQPSRSHANASDSQLGSAAADPHRRDPRAEQHLHERRAIAAAVAEACGEVPTPSGEWSHWLWPRWVRVERGGPA
jgi:hypothetical protein